MGVYVHLGCVEMVFAYLIQPINLFIFTPESPQRHHQCNGCSWRPLVHCMLWDSQGKQPCFAVVKETVVVVTVFIKVISIIACFLCVID